MANNGFIDCLTGKYFDTHKDFIAQLKEKAMNSKRKIKLVKINSILYCDKECRGFLGDCESCSHYERSPFTFVEGGTCKLHNIDTGYGAICKDNDCTENIGWEEFERIKNESN